MDLKEKLNFPTPNEEKHNPECLKTEDDVVKEETTGTEASKGSHESGSQGPPSEQSDLSRQEPAPTYQSSVPDLPRPPLGIVTYHPREIPALSDCQSPSHPYSKNVSEYKPKPTPQCASSTVTLPKEVPDNMKLRNEGHSNSARCGEVRNSPPAPIPAEKTGQDAIVPGRPLLPEKHFSNIELGAFSGLDNFLPPPIDESAGSHHPSENPPLFSSSEEVDAENVVQTCPYSLECILTLNERDQKYLERRDYNVLDVQGGSSVIKDVSTGALAVRKESKSEDCEDCLRVCEILSNLYHSNLIHFLGAVREKATVKMFLQHAPYGTVREQFRDNEYLQLRPDLISHIEEQVLQAVSYLHQEGIRHGDITGDNVSVFSNWLCKLTNFDQANSVNDVSKERTNKGPSYSYYSSPELISDPKWSYSSDMWSAMLLFVEMMTGENPWHSSIERDVQYERFLQDAIFSKMYYVTKKISSYSEQRDYPKLVDEPLYQQRLQAEFGSTPEYARQLAIFDQLAALAKEVFVRDATRRPSAEVLLNSLVMIGAYIHYFTVPKPLTDH